MNRRNFIRTTAAGAALAPIVLGSVPAYAHTSLEALAQMPPEDDRILIIIQLFGGNDGLNTVIPADDDAYYAIRPGIAVRKDLCWNEVGNIYLHPSLALGNHGGVARMLEMGNLAIVQGVGYPNPNLSHFRSTDIWLSGINSSDPNVRLETGWIGRWLEERYPDFPASLPEHPLAIQFGGAFSLTLLSSKGRMGIEVTDPSGQKGVGVQTDVLDADSNGTPYRAEYDFIADIAGRSNRYAQAVKDAYSNGRAMLQSDYSKSGLAQQMGSAAALIAGGLRSRVYVVSMGGFDTHVTQTYGDAEGTHPRLLETLSDGIASFTNDMIRLGQADRIVGMTVSEFGRRPRENGSLGTDHGAASVQFVFGTQVNSGVFGVLPDLGNLNANGDLQFQVDYRSVYGEILTDWFGLSLDEAKTVLMKNDLVPVDVLAAQPQSGVGRNGAATAGTAILSVSPNPFSSGAAVEFATGTHGAVQLELTSMTGARVATLAEGDLAAGRHTARVPSGVPAGSYLLTLRTPTGRGVMPVQCVR